MKTKEELDKLKQEYETFTNKLKELDDNELSEITGGDFWDIIKKVGEGIHSIAKPVVKSVAPSVTTNNTDLNNK